MSANQTSASTWSDEPVASDASTTTKSQRNDSTVRERWIEGVSIALLAIASLTAAWCGYQANLWGGQQATHYTQAGAQRSESVRQNGIADRATQVDVAVLMEWLDAAQADNQELADFYRSKFSPVLEPAWEAWRDTDPLNNPDAPRSPFVMPEYVQPGAVKSHELELEAAELFEQGQKDNATGDNFVLATVFLAVVLFFLAVSTGLKWYWAQVGLTGLAGVMLIVALVFISTLEVAS